MSWAELLVMSLDALEGWGMEKGGVRARGLHGWFRTWRMIVAASADEKGEIGLCFWGRSAGSLI